MPVLTWISPAHLLVLAAFLLLVLAGLWVVFRRQKRAASPRPARSARGKLLSALRLGCFGFAVLLVAVFSLALFDSYRTVQAEIAPANRDVEMPANLALPLEEVTFTSGDGVHPAGWYAPARNGVTIILLHGYGGNRADMTWQAQTLVEAGYGALLYDERASGESGGTRRSYGWEDMPDVGGAIAFIQQRTGDPNARIGIAGNSIGAQIALQGAARYPEIKAVWADGASVVRAADLPRPKTLVAGLLVGSNYLMDVLYEIKLGIPAPEPLHDRIGSIAPRPIMLVGGGKEQRLVGSEAERMYHYANSAGSNAKIWVIAGGVHCDGPALVPEEYARRLVAFFDAAFFD